MNTTTYRILFSVSSSGHGRDDQTCQQLLWLRSLEYKEVDEDSLEPLDETPFSLNVVDYSKKEEAKTFSTRPNKRFLSYIKDVLDEVMSNRISEKRRATLLSTTVKFNETFSVSADLVCDTVIEESETTRLMTTAH
jgi:hypothetical protein